MRKTGLFLLTSLLAAGAPPPRPAAVVAPAQDPGSQPELDARIDAANFNRGLMATAIFHETNRVRRKLGLPLFQTLPKLAEAADLEAAVGKVYQPPSHTNPFPLIGTPFARVKFVGLSPKVVAENIALLSIYDIDPAMAVGVTTEHGQKQIVDALTRAGLKPATYRKFATLVVGAWMGSPGHREKLVDPTLRYLGCSVQPTVTLAGVDSLFCVQVFFNPQD